MKEDEVNYKKAVNLFDKYCFVGKPPSKWDKREKERQQFDYDDLIGFGMYCIEKSLTTPKMNVMKESEFKKAIPSRTKIKQLAKEFNYDPEGMYYLRTYILGELIHITYKPEPNPDI